MILKKFKKILKKVLHFVSLYVRIQLTIYKVYSGKGVFKMFSKKDEYIKPEIMIIKFGSEDIITSSTGENPEDNADPYVQDPFEA